MRKSNAAKSLPPAPRQSASQDPLHAYERFGRIDILEGGLTGSPFVNVSLLANIAQQQLDSGHAANTENLLRAAEHLSFAALAPKNSADLTANIPNELKYAVTSELNRLTNTAEELWQQSAKTVNRAIIETIYAAALQDARQAFDCGAYRPALQFARAAEALAHVADGLPATVPGDRQLSHRIAS